METKEIQEAIPKTDVLGAIEKEIKQAFAEANLLAAKAKSDGRAAILKMADVGQYILLGREHIRDKAQWISSLGIDQSIADKAVHLARNRDQLELELWPSDVAKLGAQIVGILPPHVAQLRGENDPEKSTEANNHWLNYAGKLQRSLSDVFKTKPIEKWRSDERESIRVALKPIYDLYNKLNERTKESFFQG
jgi:hypothetical protein